MATLTLMLVLALPEGYVPGACAYDKMPKAMFRQVATEFVACIKAGQRGVCQFSPALQRKIRPYCGPKLDA